MLKHILSVILFCCTVPVFCHLPEIPKFIDFNSEEFETHFFHQQFSPELVTTKPFNGALEMSTFFMYLKDVYNLRTVVETGTYTGKTTGFFGSLFDLVHTIEVSSKYYKGSLLTLQNFPNVHCHLGTSPAVLNKILPNLSQEPVIFYLDAHWYKNWPLLEELTEISKTHRDNCVIVIDDFKVPGRPDIPYDAYGEHECSYEYIQNHLDLVFSGYTVHYLIPKNTYSRAKFVAIPKKWAQQ